MGAETTNERGRNNHPGAGQRIEPKGGPVSTVVDIFSTILAVLGSICVAGVMASIVIDIASRWTTGRSIPGVVEYGEVVMVLIVYFSIAYAQLARQHVAVDILTERLPQRISDWLDVIVLVGCAALTLWFAVETGVEAVESSDINEKRFGLIQVPVWPARLAISVGFLAITFQFASQAVNALEVLRGRRLGTESSGA